MSLLSCSHRAVPLLAAAATLVFVVALSAAPPGVPQAAEQDAEKVPTSRAALRDYLQLGRYKSFPHESRVHRSEGPHGDVFTYINRTLESSLRVGNRLHPTGAAAVKELYDREKKLKGWAVEVKTGPDSDAGQGWYWYEVLSTSEGARPFAEGQGVAVCTGCHNLGRDFVRVSYPLK